MEPRCRVLERILNMIPVTGRKCARDMDFQASEFPDEQQHRVVAGTSNSQIDTRTRMLEGSFWECPRVSVWVGNIK